MRIAFDIDGVLIPSLQKIEQIAQLFFEKPDFVINEYYAEHLNEERSVKQFLNSLYAMNDILTITKPSLETVDIINRLKEKHEVFIITARPLEAYPGTLKQCMFYFDIVPVFESKKVDFMERNAIRVLVEDSLENAKSCASSRRQIFLIDKPYNQGPLWGDMGRCVMRVNNLAEVEEWIQAV